MRKDTFKLTVVALVAFIVSCKSQGTCESNDADVLILGAGMSGIAAAKTLNDNGVTNFIILEARNEIGGRMRAADFAGSSTGMWVELIKVQLLSQSACLWKQCLSHIIIKV